jgi:hypothetical protein
VARLGRLQAQAAHYLTPDDEGEGEKRDRAALAHQVVDWRQAWVILGIVHD